MVIHSYVLMDNHYHLLLETPLANLSRAMQWLNVSYTVWFNRRHGRVGHLFQGRYKAIVVEADAWCVELSRYIHLNPARMARLGLSKEARRRQRLGVDEAPNAGEVRKRVERMRTYRWSSYRAYVGLVKSPEWLQTETVLGRIGEGSPVERRKNYRTHVELAVREGLKEKPWEAVTAQVLLGGRSFVEKMRRGLRGNEKEQPALRGLRWRASWEEVVGVVEKMKGEKWEQFQDRHGDWGRDLALYLGRRHCGLKLAELGERAGGLDYRTVSWAMGRFAKRLAKERELMERVKTAEDQIKNPEI